MHRLCALVDKQHVQRFQGKGALSLWELMSSEHSPNMLWLRKSFYNNVNILGGSEAISGF